VPHFAILAGEAASSIVVRWSDGEMSSQEATSGTVTISRSR